MKRAEPARSGRNGFDCRAFAGADKRGADEIAEQRCRPSRPRLELRMELTSDEPRMLRQLDDLDEATFLECASDDETAVDERGPVVVVDLVAVTMALVDDRLPVRVVG